MARISTGPPALRLLFFAALPALSALTPFVALPALTRAFGSAGWSALAIGQGVGGFGALAVNFGWNALGPAAAARASDAERRVLYSGSLRQRVAVALLMAPVVASLAAFISRDSGSAAALMALAVMSTGLLPTWYFIGVGSAVNVAVHDTLPRLVAAVLAALILPLAHSELLYPGALLMMVLGSILVSARRLGARRLEDRRSAHRPVAGHLSLTLSGLLSSGYTSLAVVFVALASSSAVPVFAASTRFRDFGIAAVSAVANATQGWVAERSLTVSRTRHRQRRALSYNSAAGFVAAVGLCIGLGPASFFVFSGVVEVPLADAVLTGGILILISVSQSLTLHFLIPQGRTKVVALSGIITSVLGVPLIFALTTLGGSTGALGALVIAEAIAVTFQAVVVARALKAPEEGPATASRVEAASGGTT